MSRTAVTPSPGFISIQVSDVDTSAEFYERYLGAVRDTFDFGPGAVAFIGWPTFALNGIRRPGQAGPSPDTTTISLWWRRRGRPGNGRTHACSCSRACAALPRTGCSWESAPRWFVRAMWNFWNSSRNR